MEEEGEMEESAEFESDEFDYGDELKQPVLKDRAEQ